MHADPMKRAPTPDNPRPKPQELRPSGQPSRLSTIDTPKFTAQVTVASVHVVTPFLIETYRRTPRQSTIAQ